LNYLLDTCVISELVRPTPNEAVINWMSHLPNERLFLSVITIGEIRKGITKLPESKKKNQLTNWLNTLLEDYQSRIYPINLTVAENWGIIQGKAEKKWYFGCLSRQFDSGSGSNIQFNCRNKK